MDEALPCEVPLLKINMVLSAAELNKYVLPDGSDNFHDEPYKLQLRHVLQHGWVCNSYDLLVPEVPYPVENYLDTKGKYVTCLLDNKIIVCYGKF